MTDAELGDALVAAVEKFGPLHATRGLPDGLSALQAAFYVETATGEPLGTRADRERVTEALMRLVEAGRLVYLDTIKALTVVDAQSGESQRVSSAMRRWYRVPA